MKEIVNSTGAHNPSEWDPKTVGAINWNRQTKLDSRKSLNNWKHRLTAEEIARIRELTADVAALYGYDKEEAGDE